MAIPTTDLPALPSLLVVEYRGKRLTALWRDGRLQRVGRSLDELLEMPVEAMYHALDETAEPLETDDCSLVAPVASQEVWACGVTYLRSREARMEESGSADVYARVYGAERPELFFKAAGWRVVGSGGEVGVRPDSKWNVPEPELAVLSNSRAEVVAYACGNDMSSRSIEGENPLYLPQAKVYERSCALGPAAVLATVSDPTHARVRMRIERGGNDVFAGVASTADMIRDAAELSGVLHSAYPLPHGAWLLTGTSLVPPSTYTARDGDLVQIEIDGLGRLTNRVSTIRHSGATAPPRLDRRREP